MPFQGVEVVVSYVESAAVFWIQPQSDKDALAQIETNLIQMDKKMMNEDHVKEGEICAVLHPWLKNWFRAKLLKVEGNCVQVQFVDRGDTDWIFDFTHILPCPKILK